ncbi:MAG: hypothetical protein ACP5IB_08045, partial [Thermoplasmata archaeon]
MENDNKCITMYIVLTLVLLVLYPITLLVPKIAEAGYIYFIIPGTNVGISYVGFVVPLILSVYFTVQYLKSSERIPGKYIIFMLSLLILIGILSFFYPSLQYPDKNGVHSNVYEFFALLFLLGFIAGKG